MMKKLKSLRRRSKRPRQKKESKATKKYDRNNEPYETEDSPKRRRYKRSPSRPQNRSQYNRENKNPEYDHEFREKRKDLPQPEKNRQSPPKIKYSLRSNREHEYTDYYNEYGGQIEDSTQPEEYKRVPSPSRTKKSSRYNRDYELTDYDDEYRENKYNNYDYDKQTYKSGNEVLAYSTEDTTAFRRHPGRHVEYYNRTDTDYSDDSDSDCLSCTSERGQRSDYTSEYPSNYQHEDIPVSRHRNLQRQSFGKRRAVPSETEIERSPHRQYIKNKHSNRRPYHQEYEEEIDYHEPPYRNYFETNDGENPYRRNPQEVYVARAPNHHKAFTLKEQQELEEHTSRSEVDMDLDEDENEQEEQLEEPRWRKNQSRYQVFAANTVENRGVFRKQPNQNPREALLSVTEYESNFPMVTGKNTSAIKPPDKSQSIVYLPVVVMDNAVKLPQSKVVHAESFLRTVRDKAEKPLDRNMNIYLATANNEGNIFQQAQKNGVQDINNHNNTMVYTSQSIHSVAIDKKPSVISKIASKVGLHTKSKIKSEYPVQKSYIKVVPSKTNMVEGKGSKISIKSRGSKSPGKKKDRKNQMKIKSSDSAILTVINPSTSISTDGHSNESRKSTAMTSKAHLQKQKNIQEKEASQTLKNQPTTDELGSPITNLTKQSTFDRHKSLLKPPSLEGKSGVWESTPKFDQKGKSGVCESNPKFDQRTQSLLDGQYSIQKDSKIITIKDVNHKQYEESKNVFAQSEADLPPQAIESEKALPKRKGLGSSLHNKKDSKVKLDQSKELTHKNDLQQHDSYTLYPDEYTTTVKSLPGMKKKKSKSETRKLKTSSSRKKLQPKKTNVEFSNKTEEFPYVWSILNLNSSAYVYFYQVMQYIMGLSIHGTLIEILRNSKQSD